MTEWRDECRTELLAHRQEFAMMKVGLREKRGFLTLGSYKH